MKVYDPQGVVRGSTIIERATSTGLEAATVGVLWNGKRNADNLLRIVEQRLISDFGLAGSIWANKGEEAEGPGGPATPEIIHRLSTGTAAVLVASGD